MATTIPTSFFLFMEQAISELEDCGRLRTAETYFSTMRSLRRFRNGADLRFDEINASLTSDYESFLSDSGACPNTTSFYMRIFRAAYNKAANRGLVIPPRVSPFRLVYTGIDKTVKRSVNVSVIRKIKRLDLKDSPGMAFARDLFLFSFFTRGMSFVDMAYLRVDNIKNRIITYHRRKTGQKLTIKMERCMLDIIKRHNVEDSPYLLPIIKIPGVEERRQYHNMEHYTNKHLKEIGRRVGMKFPLTMYVARHSWADVARNQGIPLSVISEGLGHNSEETTRIYLKSLNNTLIDKANKKVIDSI